MPLNVTLRAKSKEKRCHFMSVQVLLQVSSTLLRCATHFLVPLLRRRRRLGDFRRDDWCQPSPLLNVETRLRLHTPLALSSTETSIITQAAKPIVDVTDAVAGNYNCSRGCAAVLHYSFSAPQQHHLDFLSFSTYCCFLGTHRRHVDTGHQYRPYRSSRASSSSCGVALTCL